MDTSDSNVSEPQSGSQYLVSGAGKVTVISGIQKGALQCSFGIQLYQNNTLEKAKRVSSNVKEKASILAGVYIQANSQNLVRGKNLPLKKSASETTIRRG